MQIPKEIGDRLNTFLQDSKIPSYLENLDLKSLLLPAIAGATIGGVGFSRYHESDPNASPSRRRGSKLRAALAGAGLGAMAGAAVPAGFKLLQTPTNGAIRGMGIGGRAMNSMADAGIGNAGSLVGGGLGAYSLAGMRRSRFTEAQNVLKDLSATAGLKGKDVRDMTALMRNNTPEQAFSKLEGLLSGAKDGPSAPFIQSGKLHEALRAYLPSRLFSPGQSSAYGLKTRTGNDSRTLGLLDPSSDPSALKKRVLLNSDELINRLTARKPDRWLLEKLVGGIDRASSTPGLSRVIGADPLATKARALRLYDLVGRGNLLGRAGRVGLLGAGIVGGGLLQKRLTGN